MKWLLQFFSLIFIIGLLAVPKNQLYLENTVSEQCCKGSEKKDCCNNHEHKTKDQCSEKCCAACHICISSLMIALAPSETSTKGELVGNQRKKLFAFRNPFFSSHLCEIWEPPKIG